MKRDLTELNKLEMYLEGRFRYERTDREGRVTACMGKEFIISDFHKILVYKDGNELFDAICHYGSYGAEQGLLEIMGEALTENGDVVEGNLTADEIIRRLKKFEDKVHELKILPEYYEDVYSRDKSFELRKKDRDYKVGDKVCLREWKPETGYTGRKMTFRIRYIYEGTGEYGLEEGYCILGIKGV